MERRMITMRYTRRRRGSDFLHTSILLFVLLLIISCLCGGAFIRSSVTNSRHPWIPHNGDGGCSPSLSSPLYAQKSPYRLGVYPYKDNDKHDKKKELDELVNQHKLEQGANVNVNDTTNVVSNHTLLLQQQQQQEDDFILQAPKSNTSQIIDSFLNATSMNVTSSSNETTTTLHNNNKAQATIKAKKRPSVLLSPSQHFFSAFTYDMTAPKLKQEKKVNTTKTTTTIADSILANKNPNDVLTVADLEAILQDRGYVRESQQQPTQRGSSKGKTTSSTRKSSSVAFPQQSVLSYKDLTVGSTVAAGFLGMLLGITIFPNLWLIGMVLGSLYGYEISKDYQTKPPTFPLARLIVGMGRKLAKVYLKCYDTMYGIWFMYKTGQLSYEYYKRYSKLDDRFGLSEKMDAWNARFIQGKKNFDAWEQENEIGRRVLAGFRTAWLVEEKRRKQARYRIVQYAQDTYQWCKRFVIAIWDAVTGGGSSSLREVLKGIRINISESRLQEIGPRIGAAVMALVTITMIGSLYAIAPRFLGLVAIVTGIIWPTWVPELWDRLQLLADEFAATGRGEEGSVPETTSRSGIPISLSRQFGLYDKKRYSFYQREDGTRQWYRVGQPAFRSNPSSSSAKKKKTNSKKSSNTKSGSGGGGKKGKSTGGGSGPQWGWFS